SAPAPACVIAAGPPAPHALAPPMPLPPAPVPPVPASAPPVPIPPVPLVVLLLLDTLVPPCPPEPPLPPVELFDAELLEAPSVVCWRIPGCPHATTPHAKTITDDGRTPASTRRGYPSRPPSGAVSALRAPRPPRVTRPPQGAAATTSIGPRIQAPAKV